VIVPTNFNIATQLAAPAWIKGRIMGMYVLVLWGSMSLGSLIFGRIASRIGMGQVDRSIGLRWSLFYAGLGVIIGSLAIIWLRLVAKNSGDSTARQARGS